MQEGEDYPPAGMLRTLQIIAAALMFGVTVFLGVVLYLVHVQNQGPGQAPRDMPILSLLAVVLLLVLVPMSLVMPRFLIQAAVRQVAADTYRVPQGTNPMLLRTDAGKLLAVRQTTLLVALAPLEGVAFLGCIAYMQEAQPWVLAVVATVLALMLVQFPTSGRVRAWLERQTQAVAELRQQGGTAG